MRQVAAHYSRLAMTKGYYAYARQEVHQLDSDTSGLYTGIRAAVGKNLAGFVVPKDERGEWWLMKSEAERGVEIFLPSEPEPVAFASNKRGRK